MNSWYCRAHAYTATAKGYNGEVVIYYTINARDNVYWDVLTGGRRTLPKGLYLAVDNLFKGTIATFEGHAIKYSDLKSLLTPQKKKMEIGFVFDSNKIESMFYGQAVLGYFERTFKRIRKTAVFYGDLIGGDSRQAQEKIKAAMVSDINLTGELNFMNSVQYFVVYLTHVSESELSKILNDMSQVSCFVGWGDFSFCSYLKTVISVSIGQQFLLCDGHVIFSAIEDYDHKPDHLLFDFPKHGFRWIGIPEISYLTFMSYKIRRDYYGFDNFDQHVSMSVLDQDCDLIDDYEIVVDDAKFEYLLREKKDSLKHLLGMNLSKDQFIEHVKNNINRNYIFNMEVNDYKCKKFCTDIECYKGASQRGYRCISCFDVDTKAKKIRLITIY